MTEFARFHFADRPELTIWVRLSHIGLVQPRGENRIRICVDGSETVDLTGTCEEVLKAIQGE